MLLPPASHQGHLVLVAIFDGSRGASFDAIGVKGGGYVTWEVCKLFVGVSWERMKCAWDFGS